jgi:putative ABC transport system permease protein
MGTGQVVFGLATVIIGTTIFQKFDSVHGTTAALIGSIIYKACMQLAISLGLPANLLKLITAVLFLAILVFGNYQKRHNATLKQKGL